MNVPSSWDGNYMWRSWQGWNKLGWHRWDLSWQRPGLSMLMLPMLWQGNPLLLPPFFCPCVLVNKDLGTMLHTTGEVTLVPWQLPRWAVKSNLQTSIKTKWSCHTLCLLLVLTLKMIGKKETVNMAPLPFWSVRQKMCELYLYQEVKLKQLRCSISMSWWEHRN